jgi:glycosyltransferase involved in cell wall biosynthesis
MKNKTPLVSAIIPVLNGEKYLAKAIESVLDQTYTSIEIIVVNDGSTDNSEEVARGFKEIQYHLIPHGGPGAARNYGVSQSCGEFLGFLDQDDIWISHKTERQ